MVTTTNEEHVTDNLFMALNLWPIIVHQPQIKWLCQYTSLCYVYLGPIMALKLAIMIVRQPQVKWMC